ncbi:ABC1 family-domain-containing protein [Pelagophyceae sp. CCMP2097]|nr:ABC1 family-domain-containing protein [Pelagophyceae sp. CCMP2097]
MEASVGAALRAACAAMAPPPSLPPLALNLRGSGAWLLRLEGGAATCVDARGAKADSSGAATIETDCATLAALAAGTLSALAALGTGRVRLAANGHEKEQLSPWFAVLKAAGQSVVDDEAYTPAPSSLFHTLHAEVVHSRRDEARGGRVVYTLEVRADEANWRVDRTYSDFRAVWEALRRDECAEAPMAAVAAGPLPFGACTAEPPRAAAADAPFPAQRALMTPQLLTDRRRALGAWLKRACAWPRATGDAAALYRFVGATRARCEEGAAMRGAQKALEKQLGYDGRGAAAKHAMLDRLRRLEHRHKTPRAVAVASAAAYDAARALAAAALVSATPAGSRLGFCATVFAFLVALPVRLSAPLLVATFFADVLGAAALASARPALSLACVAARRLCDGVGLSRGAEVYTVAACTMAAYVGATVLASRVLRLAKGHPRRTALFAAVDALIAPLVAQRLAALGSIWVKIGQYMSARADFVPASWQSALAILQDAMPVDGPRDVAKTLREAFTREVRDRLVEIDFSAPIASASIAQVHVAYLVDAAGSKRKVALKVQHRGIARTMTLDIERGIKIARFCARLNEDFDSTAALLVSWRTEIVAELDFNVEAVHLREARNALGGMRANVTIPEPLLFSKAALAMSFVDGAFKVDGAELLDLWHVDREAVVTQLAHVLCCSIFDIGFFNADPHPGNVLVQLRGDREAQLVLLDWGWTHRLEPRALEAWRDLAIALPAVDTAAAADALARLGYRNNQDARAPERSVQFFAHLFRDAGGAAAAAEDRASFGDLREAQQRADKQQGLREAGGRKVAALPESFLFVARVIGALRGLAATLHVTVPLADVMALHARRGKARAAAAAAR